MADSLGLRLGVLLVSWLGVMFLGCLFLLIDVDLIHNIFVFFLLFSLILKVECMSLLIVLELNVILLIRDYRFRG